MRTALVVHAHPDDEAFATGAATWVLHDAGWRVVLRVATQGWGTAADKVSGSCALLGIDGWDWLSDADRWIDDGGVNGPRTLARAEPGAVAEEIKRAMDAVSPELVLTVGSDGLTGHPDHIAISEAVQLVLKDRPCRALGARLRAQDVRAGEQLLRDLVPGEPIGSGRVTGCDDATPLEEISKAPELQRRRALDHYYEGLGTQDLADLVSSHGSRSDGLLLRAVFDASEGWQHDRFEILTA